MDIEGDDSIYQYIQEYRNAGYTVIETSSKQNKGIDEIKEIFKDQVTVITGQSGVGKSTLLNALDIFEFRNKSNIESSWKRETYDKTC